MHHRLLLTLGLAFVAAACGDTNGGTPNSTPGGAAGATAAGTGGLSSGGSTAGALAGGSGGSVAVAGTGGSTGGSGGSGGSGGVANLMPTLLSETGLYSDTAQQTLAPGVYEFTPAYALWSDTADKTRWVYMPPGGKIVTDSIARGMEYWQYPAGFKLWKEFRRDGKVIETRLLQKNGDGLTNWYMVAFKWKDDHSDAQAVVDGELNAMGTEHDIPSQKQCGDCHGAMYDNALGFSALQLSHDIPGSMNLTKAAELGWFNQPPAAAGYKLPGTEVEKKALGYLHANCGMCHNPLSKAYMTKASLDLWTRLDQIQSVQQTRAYLSTVCDQWPGPGGKGSPITTCETGHATGAPMEIKDLGIPKRVVPMAPASGGLHTLMSMRSAASNAAQMPPLGTELVDTMGLAALDAWINSLPAQ